jgi:hypothetical protein
MNETPRLSSINHVDFTEAYLNFVGSGKIFADISENLNADFRIKAF